MKDSIKENSKILEELRRLREENREMKLSQELFLNGPVVVFKWREADGWPIEHVSPNVEELTGYPATDFIAGKMVYSQLIHEDDLERVWAEWRSACRKGLDSFDHESYRIKTRNGAEKRLCHHTLFIKNHDKEILYYHGYIFELSEHKDLNPENSYDDYSGLVDKTIKSIIYIQDIKGRYLQVNQRFLQFYNKFQSEIIGKTDDEIFSEENINHTNTENLSVLRLKEEIEYEEIFSVDDELHTFNIQKIPFIDKCGEIEAICTVLTDKNDYEIILSNLLSSRRQHEQVQHLGQLGHWHLDLENGNLHWSKEIYKIFNLDQLLYEPSYEGFLDLVHPDDRELVHQGYQDSITKHQSYDITYRLLLNKGTVKYVRERCETEFDFDNKPIFSIGTIQDVSEFKKSEALLKNACTKLQIELDNSSNSFHELSRQVSDGISQRLQIEEALKLERDFTEGIIQTAPAIILSLDTNGTITRFNAYLEALTGYRQENVLGKDWFDLFIIPQEKSKLKKLFHKNMDQGVIPKSYINNIRTKSGNLFLIEWHNKINRDSKGAVTDVIAIGRDVTEQKRVEIALNRRSAILSAVAHLSQNLAKANLIKEWGSDELGRLGKSTDVNRVYLMKCKSGENNTSFCIKYLEWCSKGVKPLIDTKVFPGIDRFSSNFNNWREKLTDGQVIALRRSEFTEKELLFFDVDKVFSVLLVPLFLKESFWGFMGFDDCGSERRWSEAETDALITAAGVISSAMEREDTVRKQLESQQRFQDLVESTADWIWEVGIDGRYTYCSPTVEKLLGYAPQEVIGKTPFDFMKVDEIDKVLDEFKKIVSKEQAFSGLENINIHKQGYEVFIETNGVPVFDQHDNLVGYRGIDRDISERKESEKSRLKHKDELILEIHHRIKNHLQGLIGLLKQRKNSGVHHDLALNEAISQINSIAVVYGLQSRKNQSKIHFKQMLDAIIGNVTGFTDIPVIETEGKKEGLCEVSREKAVALALVLNELLMNAIKHFQKQRKNKSIYIHHEHEKDKILLTIKNPGLLPANFDCKEGRGFSTGLELAVSMLPGKGSSLEIYQHDNEVIAVLVIEPPLLVAFDEPVFFEK